MTAAAVEVPKAHVTPIKTPIVPMKIGMFGPQGSGKSTSAALLAAAISAQFYNRAPVYVVDPEAAWQFLNPVIFQAEGIELIQRPFRAFTDMQASIDDAERRGACVWVIDPLTLMWNELMQSFQQKNRGFIPIEKWGDIKAMWQDYIRRFLNSPMTCIACGRLGNEMEEVEDERKPGKTKLVKVGTKFKAGGGESFGYEPHLLLELSLERKAKKERGREIEGEGRMVHRADVLKDRTWALNGKVIRWSDKPGYERGGYRQVWEAIAPHFQRVQQTMNIVKIDSGSTASVLSDEDGSSEYYQRKQRREVLGAELHAAMELLWGGAGKAEKQMRLRVFEHIFGFRSKEAADAASLEKIERGVRILQAFEKRVAREREAGADVLAKGEDEILAQLDIDIREYDEGQAEEHELPF